MERANLLVIHAANRNQERRKRAVYGRSSGTYEQVSEKTRPAQRKRLPHISPECQWQALSPSVPDRLLVEYDLKARQGISAPILPTPVIRYLTMITGVSGGSVRSLIIMSLEGSSPCTPRVPTCWRIQLAPKQQYASYRRRRHRLGDHRDVSSERWLSSIGFTRSNCPCPT